MVMKSSMGMCQASLHLCTPYWLTLETVLLLMVNGSCFKAFIAGNKGTIMSRFTKEWAIETQ